MYPKQKDKTIQRNDYFATINMPHNMFVDGANNNEQLSLLYLVAIYSQLSNKPGIWQVMLADLSQVDGYDLAHIAQELHVKRQNGTAGNERTNSQTNDGNLFPLVYDTSSSLLSPLSINRNFARC